jgi:hypothetical protein
MVMVGIDIVGDEQELAVEVAGGCVLEAQTAQDGTGGLRRG